MEIIHIKKREIRSDEDLGASEEMLCTTVPGSVGYEGPKRNVQIYQGAEEEPIALVELLPDDREVQSGDTAYFITRGPVV